MAAETKKKLACAIYTRKSSEEGLEQEFNSLDAQREACEAFILSQRHEGWFANPDRYDDGGYSGGNMERPGLQRLLEDIRKRKVDVVVVYKVDRLTRALSDFAKIVETFDGQGVSFVSVTQQFNTTTSMGRLTLNVLLSFAQFEREVTGERIRDKFAASRKKGMWMGGPIPLGYDLKNHRLVINEAEAETVRRIFELYLKHGCVRELQAELNARGIRTKLNRSQTGRTWGGQPFGRGQLYYILRNRLYVGEAVHKGQAYPGQHDPVITPEVWARTQASLEKNRYARRNGHHAAEPSPLAGILFDDRGNRLTPTHTQRHGRRYRYYVNQALLQNEPGRVGEMKRIPAHQLEKLIESELLGLLKDAAKLTPILDGADQCLSRELIACAKQVADHWPKKEVSERWMLMGGVIARATVSATEVTVSLDREVLRERILNLGQREKGREHRLTALRKGEADCAPLNIPFQLTRRGGEARILSPTLTAEPAEPNIAVVKMIARAHHWFAEFRAGRSTQQIADKAGFDRSYIAQVMPLAFLKPNLTEDIMAGKYRSTIRELLAEARNRKLMALCQRWP